MMRVNKIKNVACKIPKVETDAEDKLLKDCDFDTSGMIILIMLFISKGYMETRKQTLMSYLCQAKTER